jgi:monothiol glutaredoxin
MSLDEATRQRIDDLIRSNDVFLFMKGNRQQPQCGFSATVIGILDGLVEAYETWDVLSDPPIREGIKEYSTWPTIPQLYVKGEFVGGCDIIQEMAASGELATSLGVDFGDIPTPEITITKAAAAALTDASANMAEGSALHLGVDANFQNKLFFGPPTPGGIAVESNGITLHLDPMSARRASGAVIDVADSPQGPAFRIDNPNVGAGSVAQMSVQELKRRLDAGEVRELLDVRTPEERAIASIPGTRLMTSEEADRLAALPKDALVVFHCHHGGRSQAAAEHFAALGFTNVHNVAGGIDAWSQEIDPSVPRY